MVLRVIITINYSLGWIYLFFFFLLVLWFSFVKLFVFIQAFCFIKALSIFQVLDYCDHERKKPLYKEVFIEINYVITVKASHPHSPSMMLMANFNIDNFINRTYQTLNLQCTTVCCYKHLRNTNYNNIVI